MWSRTSTRFALRASGPIPHSSRPATIGRSCAAIIRAALRVALGGRRPLRTAGKGQNDDRRVLRGAAMWERVMEPEHYAYGLEPNAFLAAQRNRLKPGMRALVPGDGEGRNGVWLAEQGLEVDTLDLSAHGVAKAKRLAAERGVSINAIQADALQWNWPEAAYDLVALIFLHLVEPQRRALHEKGARRPQTRRAHRPRGVPPRADRAAGGRRARRSAGRGAALSARGREGRFRQRGGPSSRARPRRRWRRASSMSA